jgi:hypothetical protein
VKKGHTNDNKVQENIKLYFSGGIVGGFSL